MQYESYQNWLRVKTAKLISEKELWQSGECNHFKTYLHLNSVLVLTYINSNLKSIFFNAEGKNYLSWLLDCSW